MVINQVARVADYRLLVDILWITIYIAKRGRQRCYSAIELIKATQSSSSEESQRIMLFSHPMKMKSTKHHACITATRKSERVEETRNTNIYNYNNNTINCSRKQLKILGLIGNNNKTVNHTLKSWRNKEDKTDRSILIKHFTAHSYTLQALLLGHLVITRLAGKSVGTFFFIFVFWR